PHNPFVISSTDVATTVTTITGKSDDWMIIDVSECSTADFLSSIKGNFNQKRLHFEFQEKTGAVLKGLKENKKILLHGDFSQELVDSLAPLLLSPLQNGQLVLVSTKQDAFNYCPIQH